MICEIKGNYAKRLFTYSAPVIFHSNIDTNVVYATQRTGLSVLKFENGRLRFFKSLPSTNDEIESIIEESGKSLWIKTYYEGVVHLTSVKEIYYQILTIVK